MAAGPQRDRLMAAWPLHGGGSGKEMVETSQHRCRQDCGCLTAGKSRRWGAPYHCRQDCGCFTARKSRRWRLLHTAAGRTVAASLQEKVEGGDCSTPLQAGLWLLHCRKSRRWRLLHTAAGRIVAAALQEIEEGCCPLEYSKTPCWLYTPW
jgi:hypothetical protein